MNRVGNIELKKRFWMRNPNPPTFRINNWFFGYIFDLPKRFIEEELVNGLASCISNEKNLNILKKRDEN